MENENEPIESEESSNKPSTSSTLTRSESIHRCLQSLEHSVKCKDKKCTFMTCIKMKKVVEHVRKCRNRAADVNKCAVCKQLIALCYYHAKQCTVEVCEVPFCVNIREKMEQQKKAKAQTSDSDMAVEKLLPGLQSL